MEVLISFYDRQAKKKKIEKSFRSVPYTIHPTRRDDAKGTRRRRRRKGGGGNIVNYRPVRRGRIDDE